MKLYLLVIPALYLCSCSGTETSNTIAPVDSLAMTEPASLDSFQQSFVVPPLAPPDYDTSLWTELRRLDSTILIDMRYATDSNFVGEKMYDCSRCFLRPEVAGMITSIHQELQKEALGLKMLDCYRPRPIQWKLWEKVPDPRYVTDPKKGSMHNRGAAVDLTIVDAEGEALEMGTAYDYFGREAYHTYTELPDSVLARRDQLKQLMEANGFRSIRTEWWHYSFTLKNYPLSDMVWNCPE